MKINQRLHMAGLLFIIFLAFSVRLYKLGDQSLWYDETVSAFLAGQTVSELISHTARDIHPPAYYLLLQFWAQAAGIDEFSLAFFSLICGVLLIPLTYVIACRLINRKVGLLAAFLMAISPFNVWYSQEVRMYTLGALLGLLVLVCALSALTLKAGPDRRFWLGYLIAAAIGLYTLYYFAFLLVALNLLLLFYILRPPVKPANLKPLILTNILLLIIYLPWLPVALRQATNPPVPPWRSPPDLLSVTLESWSALALGQSVEPRLVWPVLIMVFGLLILGLLYSAGTRSSGPVSISPAILLMTYTFGPLLLIYLFSFITPLYHVRYLFTYSPTFYILVAAGLVWLVNRDRFWMALAAAIILIAASLLSLYRLHFDPQYRSDDFRSAVAYIQERWQPGDVVLVNAGYIYTAYLYYAGQDHAFERRRLLPYQPDSQLQPLLLQTGTVDGDPQLGWGDPRSDFYAMNAVDTMAALDQLDLDFSRLWLLRAYDTVTDPQAIIRTWLANRTIPLEDQLFSGPSNIRAQAFLLTNKPPPDQPAIPFDDGLLLLGWQMPDQAWQPGDTIPLKFWWQATDPAKTDYKISLKLWTSSGELAAQGQDEWPAGTLYRSSSWPSDTPVYHPAHITLPSPLPPDQYWLNVELYHPETVQPLARQDQADPVVTLGSVLVVPAE